MHNLSKTSTIGIITLVFIIYSCKGDVPKVVTAPVTNITGTSALCGGTITDEGSGPVIERGVCWSINANPRISGDRTIDGNGGGTFVSALQNLKDKTTYHVRAYASNEEGIVYGNEEFFTTSSIGGQGGNRIIADHTIVDRYDDIPQRYIDSVKKMLVTIAGMSHSHGYYTGALLLEQLDTRFQVVTSINQQPVPYPTKFALTLAKPWNTGSTIWTSPSGIADAKVNQLNYSADNPYDAYIFGWSYQATWDNPPGGGLDPIYKVRWAGQTDGGVDGNRRWGLDAGDSVLTNNRVCMDTYLDAWEQFIDYCKTHYPTTQMIFSTLIVDGHEGTEDGYQRELKSQHIRNYVNEHENVILFDFGDILSHSNSGEAYTAKWNDGGNMRSHPQIHPENMMDYDSPGR